MKRSIQIGIDYINQINLGYTERINELKNRYKESKNLPRKAKKIERKSIIETYSNISYFSSLLTNLN